MSPGQWRHTSAVASCTHRLTLAPAPTQTLALTPHLTSQVRSFLIYIFVVEIPEALRLIQDSCVLLIHITLKSCDPAICVSCLHRSRVRAVL